MHKQSQNKALDAVDSVLSWCECEWKWVFG